jgi:hypothetical protein
VVTLSIARMIVLILLGFALFWCLLFVIGLREGIHLKRRKKVQSMERDGVKAKIILIYLLSLCISIILCFLILNYWIRGDKLL